MTSHDSAEIQEIKHEMLTVHGATGPLVSHAKVPETIFACLTPPPQLSCNARAGGGLSRIILRIGNQALGFELSYEIRSLGKICVIGGKLPYEEL